MIQFNRPVGSLEVIEHLKNGKVCQVGRYLAQNWSNSVGRCVRSLGGGSFLKKFSFFDFFKGNFNPRGFSASGPSGRIFEGGLKENDQKK